MNKRRVDKDIDGFYLVPCATYLACTLPVFGEL